MRNLVQVADLVKRWWGVSGLNRRPTDYESVLGHPGPLSAVSIRAQEWCSGLGSSGPVAAHPEGWRSSALAVAAVEERCSLCGHEAAESTWRGIAVGWRCRLMIAGRASRMAR